MKLADTQDLGSCASRLAGSSPASPTILRSSCLGATDGKPSFLISEFLIPRGESDIFPENSLAHKVGWASCPTGPFWEEQTDKMSILRRKEALHGSAFFSEKIRFLRDSRVRVRKEIGWKTLSSSSYTPISPAPGCPTALFRGSRGHFDFLGIRDSEIIQS